MDNAVSLKKISGYISSLIPSTLIDGTKSSPSDEIEMQTFATDYLVENQTNNTTSEIKLSQPQLRVPLSLAEKEASGGADATLTTVLAELMEVLSEYRMEHLKNRLHTIQTQQKVERNSLEFAAKRINELNQALKNAEGDAERAKLGLEASEKVLDQAKNLVKNAEADLTLALTALEEARYKFQTLPRETPTEKKIEAAKVVAEARELAKQKENELEAAKLNQTKMVTFALHNRNKSYTELLKALDIVSKITIELTEGINAIPDTFQSVNQSKSLIDTLQDIHDGASMAIAFMLVLQELMGKNSQDSLKARLDTQLAQQKALQAAAAAAIKKQVESQENAEKLNKVIGILAKVLGAVMVAAGVALSLFSGGASLVLAGIGLAFFAVDVGLEIAGKETLTGMIMKPVMEKVQELFTLIAKAVEKELAKDPSISEEERAKISAVVAAISTAFIIITAIALVPILLKGVGNIAARLIPALKTFAQSISKKMTELIPAMIKNADKMALPLNRFNMGMAVFELSGTIAEIFLNLGSASFQLDGARAKADVNTLTWSQDYLRKQIDLLMKDMSRYIRLETGFITEMSEIISNKQQALQGMIRNLNV